MFLIGGGLGFIFMVLAIIGVDFAGKPVHGTEGLITQEQMLLAVFQGALGLAVALATIFYALRNSDIANLMYRQFEASQSEALRGIVEQVAVAMSDVTTYVAAVAGAQRIGRRRWDPRKWAAGRLSEHFYVQLIGAIARLGEAVVRVRGRDSRRARIAEELHNLAIEMHRLASSGASSGDLETCGRRARELTEQLRETGELLG
jgi:hypothetical protein